MTFFILHGADTHGKKPHGKQAHMGTQELYIHKW